MPLQSFVESAGALHVMNPGCSCFWFGLDCCKIAPRWLLLESHGPRRCTGDAAAEAFPRALSLAVDDAPLEGRVSRRSNETAWTKADACAADDDFKRSGAMRDPRRRNEDALRDGGAERDGGSRSIYFFSSYLSKTLISCALIPLVRK